MNTAEKKLRSDAKKHLTHSKLEELWKKNEHLHATAQFSLPVSQHSRHFCKPRKENRASSRRQA